MKQIRNAWLVIIGCLLVTTFAITSCSKKDDPAPPVIPKPTITSFTPSSVSPGETVTITGTNFTGSTAVTFGGTAAKSFTVVNATTITAVAGTGASGNVAVVSPGGTATLTGFILLAPKIDGYNNSNEVGAISLRAHWTFDDTKNEAVSAKAAEKSVGTMAYSAGVIGKGLDLTNAYLIYPEIPNLDSIDALPNFTISLWSKVPDNTSLLSSLFQINGVNFQDIWPLVGVATRTNGNAYSLAAGTTHVDSTGTHPSYDALFLDPNTTSTEGFSAIDTGSAKGWALITVTYDGPTRLLTYYGNGVVLGTRTASNIPGPATNTFALLTPAKVSFGTFEFIEDFPDGIYGHPPAAADRPWASHGITASLDDVRIFNGVLTPAEITALLHLGKAGR